MAIVHKLKYYLWQQYIRIYCSQKFEKYSFRFY